MTRWASIIANGTGLTSLIFLLLTNGVPTGGQPLFIVLLVAAGQITALVFAFTSGRWLTKLGKG